MGFDHIYQEEVKESIFAIDHAIDHGSKFYQKDQVILGGLENSEFQEDFLHISNLMIQAGGTSRVAAEYGVLIMNHLKCFNTITLLPETGILESDADWICPGDSGLLTLSSSG
jgi:hypothetical protein